MLPKKSRLPIQELLDKRGKTHRGDFFTIKVFFNNFSYSRFGIIISKKIVNSAVQRNKIKRMLFSALELIVDKWQKADYLVVLNNWKELNQKQVNDQFISYIFH
ncbi:MAG: ribonuclease P protein component [Nanoarchaeota archaeon]